jgi:hypothetical protein
VALIPKKWGQGKELLEVESKSQSSPAQQEKEEEAEERRTTAAMKKTAAAKTIKISLTVRFAIEGWEQQYCQQYSCSPWKPYTNITSSPLTALCCFLGEIIKLLVVQTKW